MTPEMTEQLEGELMMEEYGDQIEDVTDSVKVYQKGKVMTCECGHGIGVGFGTRTVKCARCSKTLVDEKTGDRESEYGGGQMTLERFA